jgi:hypothetical protein
MAGEPTIAVADAGFGEFGNAGAADVEVELAVGDEDR